MEASSYGILYFRGILVPLLPFLLWWECLEEERAFSSEKSIPAVGPLGKRGRKVEGRELRQFLGIAESSGKL